MFEQNVSRMGKKGRHILQHFSFQRNGDRHTHTHIHIHTHTHTHTENEWYVYTAVPDF